jgi:hypothetical protein
MAAAALLRRFVPENWFRPLTVTGAAFSIVLQALWFTGWAVLPLGVDLALLWIILGRQATVEGLRAGGESLLRRPA